MPRSPNLVLSLALVAAAAASPARAEKIGIVAFRLAAETEARVAEAAKGAAEDLGWQALVLDSGGSLAEHSAQVDRLLKGGVDAIVLAMGRPPNIEPQLRAAKASRVPVVTVLSGASPHALFDVTVNEFAVGAQIGMHLLSLMGFEGNLIMERDDGAAGPRARGRVMDLMLEANPRVRLVGQHAASAAVGGPGRSDDVRAGVAALLGRHAGEVKAIWAATDTQAFIVDDLLRAQGVRRGQVLLTGIDGGPEAFRRIRDPESLMTATAAIPYELMGEAAVHALADLLAGTPREEIVSGPYLVMDAVLVDASNVPEENEWPW